MHWQAAQTRLLLITGQHDRMSVTTKHENRRELGDNEGAAGDRARNNAMARKNPYNRLELDAVGTAK